MQKILNVQIHWEIVLAIAGFILIIAFVIPTFLKLKNKSNGEFRANF